MHVDEMKLDFYELMIDSTRICVDFGEQPGRPPKEIGKRPCIWQFLPHFPQNLGFPNIFSSLRQYLCVCWPK